MNQRKERVRRSMVEATWMKGFSDGRPPRIEFPSIGRSVDSNFAHSVSVSLLFSLRLGFAIAASHGRSLVRGVNFNLQYFNSL